jgi:hypothetical protein
MLKALVGLGFLSGSLLIGVQPSSGLPRNQAQLKVVAASRPVFLATAATLPALSLTAAFQGHGHSPSTFNSNTAVCSTLTAGQSQDCSAFTTGCSSGSFGGGCSTNTSHTCSSQGSGNCSSAGSNAQCSTWNNVGGPDGNCSTLAGSSGDCSAFSQGASCSVNNNGAEGKCTAFSNASGHCSINATTTGGICTAFYGDEGSCSVHDGATTGCSVEGQVYTGGFCSP